MKHTLALSISLFLLTALIAVNVQLTFAEGPCAMLSCGAGTFDTGGIHSSLVCQAGYSCWWNRCQQRAGQCQDSYSEHCSQTGPLGCGNEPCTGLNDICGTDAQCCYGYVCTGVCSYPSPIMINLKNNSSNYQLTSYTDGVSFDINASGVPLRVGWTEPDSLIGLLALDRNGNGTIDDGSELFGTGTKKRDGRSALNGFEALVDLDGGPDVSDGTIDVNDPHYALLRLWFDYNHDGVSQAAELVSLSHAGVHKLFTAYEETPRMDRHGNVYKYEGSALVVRNGKEHRHKLFDVFLITPTMTP